MRENLVPEKRADKNGQLTTRWVKSEGASSSAASMPAPSLSSVQGPSVPSYVMERPFIPTGKQTRIQHHMVVVEDIDRRLPAKSKQYSGRHVLSFSATDVQVYDVMSVTRDNKTAAVLLSEGIRTSDEAIKYLKGLSAEKLIDDRSELTQKALARRIGSKELIEFGKYYNPELWHSGAHLDRYLDGVEAFSYPKLQYKRGPFFADILTGKIRLSDMKTIGIRTCSRILLRNDNTDALQALANGSANYTAEELRAAFNTADGNYATYEDIIQMAQTYGGEWAASIDWKPGILASNAIPNAYRRNGQPRREKEFIEYSVSFSKSAKRDYKELYELFSAGVTAEFAAEKSEDPKAYTVGQLIAMHDGVPAPITSGWI